MVKGKASFTLLRCNDNLFFMNRKFNIDKELCEWILRTLQLGNKAVHKAQEENRKLGLPNIYSKNGTTYYELPDGTITMEEPAIFKK